MNEKPYKVILRYFGGNPEEFVYIGDNPNKDFITAKKLGMNTVRVIRESGEHMKTVVSGEYDADKYTNFYLKIYYRRS